MVFFLTLQVSFPPIMKFSPGTFWIKLRSVFTITLHYITSSSAFLLCSPKYVMASSPSRKFLSFWKSFDCLSQSRWRTVDPVSPESFYRHTAEKSREMGREIPPASVCLALSLHWSPSLRPRNCSSWRDLLIVSQSVPSSRYSSVICSLPVLHFAPAEQNW